MSPTKFNRSFPPFLSQGLISCVTLLCLVILTPSASGQTQANQRDEEERLDEKGEVVELSPFVVSESGDIGYRAANTLSGSRMNAPLFLTPAAISVLTKELLDDIGAENTEQFVTFAVNADRSFGDATGVSDQQVDLGMKVRGFAGVEATRDYFPLGNLSSDRYNVERVDLNGGPNSILYGIGGPGGILNISTKRAILGGKKKSVSVTVGSYDKARSEVDFAFPLIKDRLAFRVNALWEDRNGWRDFEHLKQKAVAFAVAYKPLKFTRIRVNFENNDRKQSVPSNFPVKDFGASEWIAAGRPMAGNPLQPGANPSPGILRLITQTAVMYAPQLRAQPFRLSTTGADMRPDLPGSQLQGHWTTIPGPSSPVSGLVDDINFNTVPENANLAGPGSTVNQNYWAGTVVVEQRIGNLLIELAYNKSKSYREPRYVIQWNQNGVLGDANPVLPGAYFADGDFDARSGQNPGTLLPDIGAVNPQASGLYVETVASYRYLKGNRDDVRASLAYELDLTKHSRWLGQHSIAGVLQRGESLTDTNVLREYNGTPNNNDPIDASHNQINRRTYLDFQSAGGLRGAMDPWANPIPASTGITAIWAPTFSSPISSRIEDSALVAAQSRFLNGRIVITGGYRRDEQRTNTARIGAVKLPNSNNLWAKTAETFDSADEEKFSGSTKTFGAVVTPLKWIGLSYNKSDSVQPQTPFDMVGRPIGARQGKGEDFGVRLNLLAGRLSLTANKYYTNDVNQFYVDVLQISNNVVPTVNAVLETLSVADLPLPKKFADAGLTQWWPEGPGRDRRDNKGNGVELTLVGKLTKNWNVSFNYSRTHVQVSNVAADLNQFMREVQDDWQGNTKPLYQTPNAVANYVTTRDNTPERDFEADPATINDAYEAAIVRVNQINRQNGQSPLLNVADSFNFFTSYRFGATAPGLLKGARIGFGGNYRGPAVIGYDAANNNAPIKGVSNFIASLMLGKTFPLKNRRSVNVQLNIYNLFANEDLLPYSAASPGNVVRWTYPRTRQSFDLRTVYSF